MADQKRYQALCDDWSALADQFLKTDEGQCVLYTIEERAELIFRTMLNDYADLIATRKDEVRPYFEGLRRETFHDGKRQLMRSGMHSQEAEWLCVETRNKARDVAGTIASRFQVLSGFDDVADSGIPIPPEVEQALDMALQPGFNPDAAFDISQVRDAFATRPAPEDEFADLRAKARRTDDPPVATDPTETIPAEALLKGIKAAGLKEVQRAYSQTFVAPRSDPPPVHVSVHPASPPPAPEPGVELGLESSIPPPPASDPPDAAPSPQTEPVAERVFSEDDQEITTGVGDLSDEDYNSIVDAEIDGSGCFGPSSTPANRG